MRIQLLIYGHILLLGIVSAATDKLVCYFGSWAGYRRGNGTFDVEDIDPFLCTHLIYSFTGISTDGSIKVLDKWNDIDKNGFKRFNNLKNINPKLKTLVAIGGWNEGSTTFSQVSAHPHLRYNFVQSSIVLLKRFGFDGLDIDWEYPGRRGGSPSDKENFVALIKEFRAAFDKHGYLVTAAVSATASTVEKSYDVPALSRYLDFVNVMTYDLHGAWDGRTGENAPLYPSSVDITAEAKQLNVDACIRGWIQRGADPEKLVLGTGAYGRTFTLRNGAVNGVGAPTSGPGAAGPNTGESGMLGYNEIVENIKYKGWTVVWNDDQKVPYAFKGVQWVGFDNPKSIGIKVVYAKKMGLGGVMIWSIETDDFKGVSGTKNPLLNTIRSSLNLELLPRPITSTTSKAATTSVPPTTFKCSKEGYFKDPADPSKFYYCASHDGGFLVYSFQCPEGLVFDEEIAACAFKSGGDGSSLINTIIPDFLNLIGIQA